MILYCDTSALVKLYVDEEDSAAVRQSADAAVAVAVCRIAWAEFMAALARRERESAAATEPIAQARERLRGDWAHYAVVEVTQSLMELAGEFADTFALRGYDSVQLAAARILHGAGTEPVCFACFDTRLQKAARVLGMATLP